MLRIRRLDYNGIIARKRLVMDYPPLGQVPRDSRWAEFASLPVR